MKQSKYGVMKKDFESEREWLAAHQRAYRATPDGQAHVRRMNLKKKGITPEQYDEMLAAQDYKCAVCQRTDNVLRQGKMQSFCVDHNRSCCPGDNSCGKCVRGLLCHNCNRAEGLLNGNAKALVQYLERYK